MKYSKSTYINALMWYFGISKSKSNKEYSALKNDVIRLNLIADCFVNNAKKSFYSD